MVMHNPYAEEYQNNTVSQISGNILRMRKWLKPGILSGVSSSRCERRIQGWATFSLVGLPKLCCIKGVLPHKPAMNII